MGSGQCLRACNGVTLLPSTSPGRGNPHPLKGNPSRRANSTQSSKVMPTSQKTGSGGLHCRKAVHSKVFWNASKSAVRHTRPLQVIQCAPDITPSLDSSCHWINVIPRGTESEDDDQRNSTSL